jgi:hypothetical protein
LTLVVDIMIFDYLTYAYFSSLASFAPPSPICLLPTSLCASIASDTFLFAVAFWSTLQLLWTFVLLGSQLVQIARQLTTLEVSNLGRYGFMGGRGGASMAGQMGHRHAHAESESPADEETPIHAHRHPQRSRGLWSMCGGGFLMHVLGLDRFTSGKAANGLARAGKAANPFDIGAVSNCRDFWTAGRELGVEYERLYEVPAEGFREAKRRHEREEGEESSGRKGLRERLMLGLGLGSGHRRGGYEPLGQA